jgi:hypothetical protein
MQGRFTQSGLTIPTNGAMRPAEHQRSRPFVIQIPPFVGRWSLQLDDSANVNRISAGIYSKELVASERYEHQFGSAWDVH